MNTTTTTTAAAARRRRRPARRPTSSHDTPSQRLADDMTDAEKIRSPGVIIGLAILIVPFIVGGIALSLAK